MARNMKEIRHGRSNQEKLVENRTRLSYGATSHKKTSTNKRVRKQAEPHIRAHKVKGRLYYYYVRGTDPEIYLGTADIILEAMRAIKLASGKKGGSFRG